MGVFSRTRGIRRKKKGGTKSLVWQFVYGGIAITVVVLLGYGVWYVTRLPALTLTEVEVKGGETVSHEELKSIVREELRGSYLFLVPKRFTYLYPEDAIVEKISAKARVHDVSVERTGRNGLSVSFKEYAPHALWCSGLEEGSSCVFIADNGYAFSEAPPLRGGAFIRYVLEERAPEVRAELFSEDELLRTEALIAGFEEELRLRALAVVRTENGDEVYHLSSGARLLVSPQQSAQTTFDNLRSVLESQEFAHIDSGNFNYIDLRFGNRVFVSEKVEVPEEIDTEVMMMSAPTEADESGEESELESEAAVAEDQSLPEEE